MIDIRRAALAAAAGALMAAGASRAAAPPPPSEPAAKTLRAHTVKPSAPIELRYALRGEPAAGLPLTIELVVTSRVAADALRIEVAPTGDALALLSATPADAADPAGGRHTRRVVVLPRGDGQYYLNVIATLVRSGVPQSRAFSIPVRVGGVASGGARTRVLSSESGRPLISLPAVESSASP